MSNFYRFLIKNTLNWLLITVLVLPFLGITYHFSTLLLRETSIFNSGTVTLSAPTEFTFENADSWQRLGNFIEDTHYKAYVINWAGMGGFNVVGDIFIEHIEAAKKQGKQIIFHLVGNAASMHALVLCHGTEVTGKETNIIIFHLEGYNEGNIYYRTKTRTDGNDTDREHQACVDNGLLTQKDMTQMWTGQEVWIVDGTSIVYWPDSRPAKDINSTEVYSK